MYTVLPGYSMTNISTGITITLFIFAIVVVLSPGAQEISDESHRNIFEYKDTIAPFNTITELLNKPTVIQSHIEQKKEDGVKTLDNLFDTHMVSDIPISKLIYLVLDLENEQNVFPRMIHTKDLNPLDPLYSPHFQKVASHFSFGRIAQNYNYIFYKIPELRGDGSFLIKWNLHESIDDKFDYIFGSWFMKEIYLDGGNYTYVRNYVHYGMINYPAYVLLGMKLGGKNDSKGFLKALQTAAE